MIGKTVYVFDMNRRVYHMSLKRSPFPRPEYVPSPGSPDPSSTPGHLLHLWGCGCCSEGAHLAF
jgi:hypothetical protein